MAPRTKFTDDLGERIVARVRDGWDYKHAAEVEGIDRKTLYRWRQAGIDGDRRYRAFVVELHRAHAEYGQKLRNKLRATSISAAQAKALTWDLERWDREAFHLPTAIKISGDEDAPPVKVQSDVTHRDVSTDQRTAEILQTLIDAGIAPEGAAAALADPEIDDDAPQR